MRDNYLLATVISLSLHLIAIALILGFLQIHPQLVSSKTPAVIAVYFLPNEILVKSKAKIELKPDLSTKTAGAQKKEHITTNLGLAAILHNLIQEQITQHLANQVDQLATRQLIVTFKLSPAGYISDIIIAKSSGLAYIDNIAIKSLIAIQPVASSKKYLRNTTSFSVATELGV